MCEQYALVACFHSLFHQFSHHDFLHTFTRVQCVSVCVCASNLGCSGSMRFDSIRFLFPLHFTHSLTHSLALQPFLIPSPRPQLNSLSQHIQSIAVYINKMPPSLGLRFFSTLSLLFLLLVLLSPTLATTSSSSSSDDLDSDSSNNNDRPSVNYTYQPPTLQQQHVFAVDSSSSSLIVQNTQNTSTMCNKAASNPNRVVLPANVTPSHYTLSIVPDLKEFTFGGQVAIE